MSDVVPAPEFVGRLRSLSVIITQLGKLEVEANPNAGFSAGAVADCRDLFIEAANIIEWQNEIIVRFVKAIGRAKTENLDDDDRLSMLDLAQKLAEQYMLKVKDN